MADPARTEALSYEAYRAAERGAPTKSEYVGGETYAMAGAKRAHNRVAANLIAELSLAVRDRPCTVYTSDMRVRTGDSTGTYPDVSALCGEPRFLDAGEEDLLNPSLVVEVLSSSTEAYDRGDKFAHYRTTDSLLEYVLASPERASLEVYSREADGWKLRTYGAGDRVPLRSLGVELAVDDVYRKVFRPEPPEGV